MLKTSCVVFFHCIYNYFLILLLTGATDNSLTLNAQRNTIVSSAQPLSTTLSTSATPNASTILNISINVSSLSTSVHTPLPLFLCLQNQLPPPLAHLRRLCSTVLGLNFAHVLVVTKPMFP